MTSCAESFVVLAARHAAERPDEPVLRCGDTARSWSELEHASTRMAHALAQRGVGFADLVTIALPNGPEFIEASLALWKLGATPQPVSPRAPDIELQRIADLANSRVVIAACDDPQARPPRIAVGTLCANGNDQPPLPAVVSPAWKAPTSGGSTGSPKLIVSGEPALLSPDMLRLLRLGQDDVVLMPAPLSHNAPFMISAYGLLAGARLVLMPRFEPEEVLRLIAQEQVTWLYLVPTMMHRIARLPAEVRARYDISSLRTVWHMAAPCAPWLKAFWIDWVGAEKIHELYAGTEAQAVTAISGTEWLERRGSVGRAVIGQIRILRSDGSEAAPGETGDVYMRRSPGQRPSYHYKGAAAQSAGDGWETLGDVGSLDADGYLYLSDRRADMILVGGANIYPAEIEQALDAHPAVCESVVVGLPDEDLGARLHAIVHAAAPLTGDELDEHVARYLAPHKRPRSYEFVHTALRDAAGKVQRARLRRERLGETSAKVSS